jgi:hypothetical protein
MLVTHHVSGIIMHIIRSTVKEDKLHTVCVYGLPSFTVLLMMGIMIPETR